MSTEKPDFKSLVRIVKGIYAEHEAELRNDQIDGLTEERIEGFRSELKRLGLERYHPHCCRKTLATMIIKKNPNSLELIQRLLNHPTPTMTLRYLMGIPNISTAVQQHIREVNRKRIVNVLVATGIRHCEISSLLELPDK